MARGKMDGRITVFTICDALTGEVLKVVNGMAFNDGRKPLIGRAQTWAKENGMRIVKVDSRFLTVYVLPQEV